MNVFLCQCRMNARFPNNHLLRVAGHFMFFMVYNIKERIVIVE